MPLYLGANDENMANGAAVLGKTSVTIGGVTVTGAQARTIFGLRSATFTLTYADGTFTFSVTGFGHGVGMSQCGAVGYAAEQGMGYRDILQHYYTGAQIRTRTTRSGGLFGWLAGLFR